MLLAVFRSPRSRRRALWLGGLLVAACTLLILNVVLPRGGAPANTIRPGRPELVSMPRKVPLTAERRRAIDTLLDSFVPAAVERRDPTRALSLVTPAFRTGVTRADWARGALPVMPYQAEGDRFHGWTLDYSLADEIGVDLMLRPDAHESMGAVAFTAVFKRHDDRWLIDSFVPAAFFAPDHARIKKILAQPDLTPAAKGS
jgi:hypothetical protein